MLQQKYFLVLIFLSLFLLPACSTSWSDPYKKPEPVVVSTPKPEVLPVPEPPVVETIALPDSRIGTPSQIQVPEPPPVIEVEPELPAVVALRGQAQASLSAGETSIAASSIERALRIQAKNPVLWLDLAEIRFAQQEFTQAENTARKALAYAGNKRDINKKAWTVIANSRYARNDKDGGLRAEAEAARF